MTHGQLLPEKMLPLPDGEDHPPWILFRNQDTFRWSLSSLLLSYMQRGQFLGRNWIIGPANQIPIAIDLLADQVVLADDSKFYLMVYIVRKDRLLNSELTINLTTCLESLNSHFPMMNPHHVIQCIGPTGALINRYVNLTVSSPLDSAAETRLLNSVYSIMEQMGRYTHVCPHCRLYYREDEHRLGHVHSCPPCSLTFSLIRPTECIICSETTVSLVKRKTCVHRFCTFCSTHLSAQVCPLCRKEPEATDIEDMIPDLEDDNNSDSNSTE